MGRIRLFHILSVGLDGIPEIEDQSRSRGVIPRLGQALPRCDPALVHGEPLTGALEIQKVLALLDVAGGSKGHGSPAFRFIYRNCSPVGQ